MKLRLVDADRPGAGWDPGDGVYPRCRARKNLDVDVDVDDDGCRAVMLRYHLATTCEPTNLALRPVAVEALSGDEARVLLGSGREGDLEELRSRRTS